MRRVNAFQGLGQQHFFIPFLKQLLDKLETLINELNVLCCNFN